MSKLTISIGLLLSSATFYVYYNYGFGPSASSDDFKYFELAANLDPDSRQATRYGHMYIYRQALSVLGDPIEASMFLSALSVALMTLLVYSVPSKEKIGALARSMAASMLPLNYLFIRSSGAFNVDVSSTLFLTLGLYSYLAIRKHGYQSSWMYLVLGISIVFCFRTKEVSAVFLFFFLAHALYRTISDHWRESGKSSCIKVGVGILSSVSLFIILDWLYLGHPLFGFGFVDVKHQIMHQLDNGNYKYRHTGRNWLEYVFDSRNLIGIVYFAIPFLFHLKYPKSGLAPLLLLVPIFVLFFSAFSFRVLWASTIVERYNLIMVPAFCMLHAPIYSHFLTTNKKPLYSISVTASALLILIGITFLATVSGWSNEKEFFITTCLAPVALLGIIYILIASQTATKLLRHLYIPSICFMLASYAVFAYNPQNKTYRGRMEHHVTHIGFLKNRPPNASIKNIFYSSSIYQKTKKYARSDYYARIMLRLYGWKVHSRKDIVYGVPENLARYDTIFLHIDDVPQPISEELASSYDHYEFPKESISILVRK